MQYLFKNITIKLMKDLCRRLLNLILYKKYSILLYYKEQFKY